MQIAFASMPTIHIIKSIKIDIYSGEHLPPHFHAIYNEHEILISIKTLKTIKGSLPTKQYNQVKFWILKEENKIWLLDNFYRLNPQLRK